MHDMGQSLYLCAHQPRAITDLTSVGLKATSYHTRVGALISTSVVLNEYDVQRLRSVNSKTRVVTGKYSVTGALAYVGESTLVSTGGVQLEPIPTGSVKSMAGCQCKVTNSGQVIMPETNPVERMIAIDLLDLEKM